MVRSPRNKDSKIQGRCHDAGMEPPRDDDEKNQANGFYDFWWLQPNAVAGVCARG